MDTNKMTLSALKRFALAVDMVMDAEFIGHRERTKLIGLHAYDFD